MALFKLLAMDVSDSLLAVAYDTVVPPTRKLIVSDGLSVPLPIVAPVADACVAGAVTLIAQFDESVNRLNGSWITDTVELLVVPLCWNSLVTDVGSAL